ncbi:MAG TPA: alpha/beta hydrolase [Dehalococcoidia bacterium]|nr:alpha/beta hydrolase [Dehalococcoidia bacterium]
MSLTANERYVAANGLRFHLYDWGGTGRPLLLLHGLASNARIWDLVAPLLAEHARVVAVDQRGHGLSTAPDSGYGFERTAADVAALIEALGFAQPVIAGHSWGANVAVEFAARNPGGAAGLVLVDGGIFSPRSDGLSWEEAEKRLAPPRIAGTPRTQLLERIRGGDLAPYWRPEFEPIIMAGFAVAPDDTVAPYLSFERHLQIVRALWEADTPARFPEVTCPVLVLPALNGGAEQVAQKQERVLAAVRRLPHGSVVWLEDSIHDVPLQRPELVARAIVAFLDGLPAAGAAR